MPQTYWLDLFTVETWKEFLDHGGIVSGFSDKRWATVQKIKPGDHLLCYLTRVSRWVGLLEVVSKPFFDEEPIWSSQVYPSRVEVRVVLALQRRSFELFRSSLKDVVIQTYDELFAGVANLAVWMEPSLYWHLPPGHDRANSVISQPTRLRRRINARGRRGLQLRLQLRAQS